jgi:hypothetical protein
MIAYTWEDDVSDARFRFALVALAVPLVTIAVSACGGAPPKQQGEENGFDTTLSGRPVAEGADVSPHGDATANEHGFTDDQKAQMQVALRRGGAKAAQCVDVVAHSPRAEGEVKVKFDGQKGRAVDVEVPSVFTQTPKLEDCIKNAFMHEYVMRFDGELVVPFALKLEPKGQ